MFGGKQLVSPLSQSVCMSQLTTGLTICHCALSLQEKVFRLLKGMKCFKHNKHLFHYLMQVLFCFKNILKVFISTSLFNLFLTFSDIIISAEYVVNNVGNIGQLHHK